MLSIMPAFLPMCNVQLFQNNWTVFHVLHTLNFIRFHAKQKANSAVALLLQSAWLLGPSKGSLWVTLWHVNKTHWRQLRNPDLDCQVHKAPESGQPYPATADDGHPDCLLSLLPMTAIQTASLVTAVADQVAKAPESRLPSLATAEDDLDTGQPWGFLTVINEFCLHVTLSLSFFGNLSTQTRVFWVLTHGTRGPEEWNHVEMMGQGAGIVLWKF